jgi:hypothetical protein
MSGAVTGSVNWTHDNFGRMNSETAVGNTIPYAYDDDGALTQAGDMDVF